MAHETELRPADVANHSADTDGAGDASRNGANPPGATPAPDLLDLGPGGGGKVERGKLASDYLRGGIAEELSAPTSHFTEDAINLLKFHGTYQQEDRDQRQARKEAGAEKAYQFMVRSRIPGGALTAAQYLAHDELADRYANGTLRITTRQGFQLHGVLKGDLRATIADINASLLSTLAACGDVNRNVMACPAPLASRAHAQVEELAHALAMRLAPHTHAYAQIWLDGEELPAVEAPLPWGHGDDSAGDDSARDAIPGASASAVEPLYGPTYLPRKFKIGVAFPGDNCVDVYTQDIGLVPELAGEEVTGFTVLIGGGLGTTHGKATTYPRLASPFAFVSPEQLTPVVEAIVTIQRDYGDRQNRKHARMKYLVAERGVEWFRAEAERRLGFALAAPRDLGGLWGDPDDHLGWRRQADGRWFLGLYVENGRIKDTPELHLRTALRTLIERYQPGVRLTAQQNILLTAIDGRRKAAINALLARHGVTVAPESLGLRRFAMACPALPTCGQALAEAERALPALIRQIEADMRELGLGEEPVTVRMTGCPNGCARPYMGDIGIVGRSKDLYALYVGGDWANTRLNTQYTDSVSLAETPALVRRLLLVWRDHRQAGERFGDFCQRVGVEALRALVEQVAATVSA